MLKERIEFLSKRKQISRKDLVEGLVTQHISLISLQGVTVARGFGREHR